MHMLSYTKWEDWSLTITNIVQGLLIIKELFVCLFIWMIFSSRELGKIAVGNINAKAGNSQSLLRDYWINTLLELHKRLVLDNLF